MTLATDSRPGPAEPLAGDVAATLARFLAQLAPATAADGLDEDTPLLASGRLDSLGVLQLVGFLSETYGVEVGDEDFTEENFATFGALVGFVVRRTGGG